MFLLPGAKPMNAQTASRRQGRGRVALSAWASQWTWPAKLFRRKVIQARHWLSFVERSGEFSVERPPSNAMQGFAKIGAWRKVS